ncbi:MAG: RNB domain-containing ribonuclease [Candidatus Sericytochromatia bacterium]|nr:RNB domain-containing ribonuclease [Candidatus Sericytochromatia bacterium]
MTQTNNQNYILLRKIAHQAMVDKGLFPDFTPAVISEMNKIKEAASENSPNIRDLRDLIWCSIDNDDSRDLDQLSVAVEMPTGEIRILIAIADVDALVKKDSEIDRHASHNTTSIYTPVQIFPMLPERLSTDLTSLNYNCDRLSIVIDMNIAEDGTIKDSEVYRALVHNHAKLAYNSVSAWLDGNSQIPEEISAVNKLDKNIKQQYLISQKLKAYRRKNGALDFETIKARPTFENGKVKDLEIEKSNSSKNMIEDFMIAANGVTARYLEAKNFPSLRRVVRTPKRWDRIAELAAKQNYKLPEQPDSKALELFLEVSKKNDPTHFPDISLSIIKLLGPGEYVVEIPNAQSLGHFGLAVKDYSHSTAPNRRYPDIITQRLLKAAMSGNSIPYNNQELEILAKHCTDSENLAKKVERQVEKSANISLLESKIGQKFDAIVTGSSNKGTWIRLIYPPIEGKLVNPSKNTDVGDKIHVQLIHTDVERGFIDFKDLN